MRYLRYALLGLLALASVALTLAAACGGDGQQRTDIPEVDAVIGAVLNEDIDTLTSLVIYEQAPCSTSDIPDIPKAPPCPASEPDGTPVDVLSIRACKPAYVSREEVPGFLRERIGGTELEVYAVYRTGSVAMRPDTDYTLIFSAPAGPGAKESVAMDLARGGIASLDGPCTSFADLAALLEDDGAEAILSAPEPGD